MSWAYLDKGEVLHIVEDLQTATRFTGGVIVETDHPHEGGYPTVNGEQIVYEQGRAFDRGNIAHGHEIDVPYSIQAVVDKIIANT